MGKTPRRRGSADRASFARSEPKQAEAWLRAADEARQRGEFAQAIQWLGKVLKVAPDAAEVWHVLAGLHFQQGDQAAAAAALTRAVSAAPGESAYLIDLGGLYLGLGKFDEAESALRRALAIVPDSASAEYNLSHALFAQGKVPDAITHLRSLTARNPGYAEAHFNLGVALAAQGRSRAAIAAFEKALSLEPDNLRANLELARAYQRLGLPLPALEHYRRYTELAAKDVEALCAYAELLYENGDTREAIAGLRRYWPERGRDPHVANLLGRILHDSGDIAGADAVRRDVLRDHPLDVGALAGLTRLRRIKDRGDPLIGDLQRALLEVAEDSTDAAVLQFALGKVCDDVAEYARAFEHFRAGNAIRGRSARYQPAQLETWVDRLLSTFDGATVMRLQAFGDASRLPVFVLGMPRSGTTLAEQILSSHPQAHGAGELRFFPTLTDALPELLGSSDAYPECCAGLERPSAADITARFLALLRRHSAAASRVADKLPGNFFNIGLIAGLFPNCRILHCRRNPLDTCLSIYFQYFGAAHDYAWDLEHIAHFYAQYRRVMRHWRALLPEHILDLDYQMLVDDLEGSARRLLGHCGLAWDPRCLEYFRTERDVRTASNWQVRQPIYKTSLERWQHYAAYLPSSILALNDL